MVINSSVTTLEERIEACLQCSLSSQLTHIEDLPIWILWRLWKSRNTLMFQQRTLHWKTIIRYAKDDVREWKQNGSNEGTTLDNRGRVRNEASISHWKRPPGGWIKCNTDGTFHHTSTSSSAGWVFRDTNGTYSGSAQARGRRVQDALESEMQAILMALQHSWSLGHRQVIVESDCQKAIEILINKTLHFVTITGRKISNGGRGNSRESDFNGLIKVQIKWLISWQRMWRVKQHLVILIMFLCT